MTNMATVLGCGVMGKGIVELLVSKGFCVNLFGRNSNTVCEAKDEIVKRLHKNIKRGRISGLNMDEVDGRISSYNYGESVNEVGYLIEAVLEDIDVKRKVFYESSALIREAILVATNTSSLNVDKLAESVSEYKNKFLGLHFFNPAAAMKLVEVVSSQHTLPEITDQAISLCEALDKTPIQVANHSGFVVNRLLLPFVNSAAKLLEANVASAEDIDKSMRLGANHPIGPLALADLIGIDVCVNILNEISNSEGDSGLAPAKALLRKVEEGKLGRKSGEGFFKYS